MIKIVIVNFLLFYISLSLANSNGALIIGLSNYGLSGTPKLEGVPYDIESAKKIAAVMGVSNENIKILRDENATKSNILNAIRDAGNNVKEGAKLFIYFSGHGTRYFDKNIQACNEGLLSYDGLSITNKEIAQVSQEIYRKADKVITFVDACHSQNVLSSLGGRAILKKSLKITPKFFAPKSFDIDKCSIPTNMVGNVGNSKSLLEETSRLGAIKENVINITSARPDEIAFDEPSKGGFATQSIRDCLLGKAIDLDASGAINLREIQVCAQSDMVKRFGLQNDYKPSTINVYGNKNYIPSINLSSSQVNISNNLIGTTDSAKINVNKPIMPQTFTNQSRPAELDSSTIKPTIVANEDVKKPISIAAPLTNIENSSTLAKIENNTKLDSVQKPEQVALPPASIQELPAASIATLKDIESQQNPQRKLEVSVNKTKLRINKDFLELNVKSSKDGYLYIVMLGSDKKSFYVLFPNELDNNNFIKENTLIKLPSNSWRQRAGGPVGIDHILVLVTETPRDLSKLETNNQPKGSPFVTVLTNLKSKSELIRYLTINANSTLPEKYAAKLLTIEEIQ